MKIDGNTKVKIIYENEYIKCNIDNHTLNEAVKMMSEQTCLETKAYKDYKNKTTQYIIINGEKYNIKTDIRIKCEVSLLEVPIVCKEYFQKKYDCESKIEIGDFYNYIIGTIEDYAYELDTDISNIKLEIKELEILNIYDKEGI